MPRTTLFRNVAFSCLAVLLLWGANGTAQAQDTTQVQAAKPSQTKDSVHFRIRHNIGTTVSLIKFDDDNIFPVPIFSYEVQRIDDAGILGFRASTLLFAFYIALQGDFFLAPPIEGRPRMALGLGVGYFFFPGDNAYSLLPRLYFTGQSRFSLGIGYNFPIGLSTEDFREGFVTALLLWRVGELK